MDGIFIILIILAALGMMIGREYPRMLIQMFCDLLLALLKALISIFIYIIPPLAKVIAKLFAALLASLSSKIEAAKTSAQSAPTFVDVVPVYQAPQQTFAQSGFSAPNNKPEPMDPPKKPKANNEKSVNPYSEPPDIDIVS